MDQAALKRHGTPNWADCATTDLAAAEAFYKAVFGWTSEHVTASDGAIYALQRLDGKMVAGIYELSVAMRGMNVPPHWATYIEVDDVEARLQKVAGAGGQVIEGPMKEPDVGTIGVIQDSVGAFVRIWQSAPHHGAEIVNVPGAMTWNQVFTKEPEKAAAFYQAVLDLEPAEREGGPMPYTLLKTGGREVAGVLHAPPETGDMPSSWDVYFASDDVDATTDAALAAGGKALREPFDVPGAGARLAVLQDPQGAVFEVIKMTQQAA